MKVKKPKQPKEKKAFTEWYKTRMPMRARMKSALFAIIGIPVCIATIFSACVIFIGDSSFAYSDEVYDSIKSAIEAYTTEGEGMGTLELQKAGIEKINWDYNNGKSVLICSIRNGFFNAKVTVDLSDNYKILDTQRNHDSRAGYMLTYWLFMGAVSIAGGTVLWFALIGLYCLSLGATNKICTKKDEKESSGNAKEVPPPPTENITVV